MPDCESCEDLNLCRHGKCPRKYMPYGDPLEGKLQLIVRPSSGSKEDRTNIGLIFPHVSDNGKIGY